MTVMLTGKGTAQEQTPSRGVVFLHSCPRALSPHLEWALAAVFGTEVHIDWAEQPIVPGSVRAEIIWTGVPGTGARLASALLAFSQVRYEVTEDGIPGRDGERFAATPSLGLFRATIGPFGDVMVHEERLRTALSHAQVTGESMVDEVARLIGTPWDDELEPFRSAHEDSTVRLMHQVV
ncbi:MAG: DUF3145 domain-containing protein [Candidatus Nanopelagicales bacterium]